MDNHLIHFATFEDMEETKEDKLKSILLIKPEEKADQKKLEEIKNEMNELRNELKAFRESNRTSEYTLYTTEHDPEYMALMAEGDFTKNDDELQERIYPSLWQSEEARLRRKELEAKLGKKQTIRKWDLVPNNVYIREFKKTDKDLEAQVNELKASGDFEKLFGFARIESDFQSVTRKDLETYIGGNLVSKLASWVLFLAVYVTYSYFIEHIPIAVRYFVGFGLGGVWYYLGHDSRQKNTTISYLWVLAGIAAHYYNIYLGYWGENPIFSKNIAFVVLSVASLIPFVFAWLHNRITLAATGLIVGYFAPFMLSDGQGNFAAYMTFALVLNLLVMVMAYLKGWKQLSFIAFSHFFIAFVVWMFAEDFADKQQVLVYFILLTVYYIVFYANFMVYGILDHLQYDKTDNIFLQIDNIFYAVLASISVWWIWDDIYTLAIFVECFAVFNIAYLTILYLKEQGQTEIIQSLWVVVLTTLNVGLIIQVFGTHINTLLAIEAVALLWLGITLKEQLLRNTAFVATVLAVVSMLVIWVQQYFLVEEQVSFLINSAILASVVTFGSLILTQMLLAEDEEDMVLLLPKEFFRRTVVSSLIVIGFLSLFFEFSTHIYNLSGGFAFQILIIIAYVMIFTIVIRLIAFQVKIDRLHKPVWYFMAIAVIFYFIYGHFQTLTLRDLMITEEGSSFPFLFHYFIILLSAFIIYLGIRDIISFEGYGSLWYTYATWFASITIMIHITMELEHIVVIVKSADLYANISDTLWTVRKTGYTITWAVFAMAFMAVGVYYQLRQVRYIALAFFGITFLKFFIYDFWFLNEIGKIFTFLIFALVLFVISRLYKSLAFMIQSGQFVLDKDQSLSKEDLRELLRLKRKREEEEKGGEQ